MNQIEKLDRIKYLAQTALISTAEQKMILQQVQIVEDRIAEYHIGSSNPQLNFFQRGFLYGAIRMLDLTVISLLNDMSIWIDGDKLITELELGDVGDREEV